jgi:hypothetical protein
MRQVPDSQIGASADGLAHEYMRNRGGASGGLAGACLKKTRNPTTVKPQRPFNRLAHRNPDTPSEFEFEISMTPSTLNVHHLRSSSSSPQPSVDKTGVNDQKEDYSGASTDLQFVDHEHNHAGHTTQWIRPRNR